MDDQQLIALIRRQNQQAFRKLYKKYLPKIYRTVANKIAQKEEIQDIVQEVFLSIFENLDKYDSNYAFSTWAYSITHHKVCDFLRKKYKFDQVGLDALELADENLEDDDNEHSHKLQQRTQKLISTLDGQAKKLLELRFLQNKKISEVSTILNISVANAKVIQHRAIKKIQSIISQKS